MFINYGYRYYPFNYGYSYYPYSYGYRYPIYPFYNHFHRRFHRGGWGY